jgi:hypothetical protein
MNSWKAGYICEHVSTEVGRGQANLCYRYRGFLIRVPDRVIDLDMLRSLIILQTARSVNALLPFSCAVCHVVRRGG